MKKNEKKQEIKPQSRRPRIMVALTVDHGTSPTKQHVFRHILPDHHAENCYYGLYASQHAGVDCPQMLETKASSIQGKKTTFLFH